MILVLGTAMMMVSCSRDPQALQEEPARADEGTVILTPEQQAQAGLAYGSIEEKMLSSDFPARGKLILPPANHALVTSVSGGIIHDILVVPGQQVSTGQVLAYIKDPELIRLQQDYLEARAALGFQEKEVERQRLLGKEEVNAAKVLQKAESELASLKARTEGLQASLRLAGIDPTSLSQGLTERIPLRSRIPGRVEKIMASLGQHLSVETPVFEIVDARRLYLEMAVFEKDILTVRTGQRVTFDLGSANEKEYEARVLSIGSVVQDEARVVSVLAEFVNEEGLMPGMFAAAKIHAGENLYRALPEEAILTRTDQEQYLFYTLDTPGKGDMTFHRLAVSTGFREDGWAQVECASPLPEGARVVVKGVYYVWAEMEKNAEE